MTDRPTTKELQERVKQLEAENEKLRAEKFDDAEEEDVQSVPKSRYRN